MAPAPACSCPVLLGSRRLRRTPSDRAIGTPVIGLSGSCLAQRQTALPGCRGTLSCLCPALGPRRSGPPCHGGRPVPLPQYRQGKPPGIRSLSGLNHTASAPAAYASRFDCSARARLASGCLAGCAGRGSARRLHPLGSSFANLSSRFLACHLLSRRPWPGATTPTPGSGSLPEQLPRAIVPPHPA